MNVLIDAILGECDELPENWDDIYSEYIGLRENKSSSFILELLKEITYLQVKVYIINKCVEVLAVVYNRDLVNELKLCGCKGKFDWSNKEQYSNDLKSAVSYSKKYISQYSRKENELEQYSKKHGNKSITRKDFNVWAITLGKYMGFRIDFKEIYVAEWCDMMNEYDRYCEVENAKAENIWQKTK